MSVPNMEFSGSVDWELLEKHIIGSETILGKGSMKRIDPPAPVDRV